MNPYSLEHINPLIVDIKEHGRSLQVLPMPVSGTQVSSRASAARNNSSGNQFKRTAERSMMYAVQRALSQVIRDVFGHSTLGRVASDIYPTNRI